MDIQDVSTEEAYKRQIQQVVANAEMARFTKGQMPHRFPSAQALTQEFLMKLQIKGMRQLQGNGGVGTHMIYTSQVPEPYHPCTLPATALEPMLISQMRLETHHRGRSIVVRVLTPPDRMTAVMAIVEDVQGTAVLLQLYHQPPEHVVPAATIIKPAGLFLLKEPYFKKAVSDGTLSLRVDHVSDVIALSNTDELVPRKWRKAQGVPTNGASAKLRAQGNEAVGHKLWAEAEQLYTLAIEAAQTAAELQPALLNRSLTNLRLDRPAAALSDAIRAEGLSRDPSEKVLFRKASALYEMRQFDKCLTALDELSASFPSTETAAPMLARVKTRLREQNTGVYDFGRMRKQARAMLPLIDVATYSAPVEICSSPQRGRGLFTTRNVVAGELLLCEKAVGYKYAGEEDKRSCTFLMNVTTKRMTMGGQADVLTQLVQKLYHDPELSRAFAEVYDGDYNAVSVADVDGKPVVDTFRVERVVALTGFGSPRVTQGKGLFSDDTDLDPKGSQPYTTSGVYPLIGHINHGCIGNTRRSFIGDVQIVRAARDMEAGTEVFFSYKQPEQYMSHAETQAGLANWGFECQCALCLNKKSWSARARRTRQDLYRKLSGALGKPNIGNAREILNQMEATYSAAEREPGAVRFELWVPYFALGALLLQGENPAEAIEVTLQGFEALGFIIVAAPPRKKRPGSKAPQKELLVEQWGMPVDYTPAAFYTLFEAYKQLCPQLAAKAKEYARTAFSIVVGDLSTIGDLYPELAQD